MVNMARWNGSEWVPCFTLSEEQYDVAARPRRKGRVPREVRVCALNDAVFEKWRQAHPTVPALAVDHVFESVREAARALCYSRASLAIRLTEGPVLNLQACGVSLERV